MEVVDISGLADVKKFWLEIVKHREATIKQEEVAAKMDVSQSFVSKLENHSCPHKIKLKWFRAYVEAVTECVIMFDFVPKIEKRCYES